MGRAASRQKVRLRPDTIRRAETHLGNLLSLVTATSRRAVALAETPAQQSKARADFFRLFVEVSTTMAELTESLGDTMENSRMRERLHELQESPDYRALIAEAEAERINSCYVFDEAAPDVSALHPGETCFGVSLHQPCKDFGGWLIGKTCFILQQPFAVLAVEYAPLKPPFKAGDAVRLVVRPFAEDGTVAGPPQAVRDAARNDLNATRQRGLSLASDAAQAHPAQDAQDAPGGSIDGGAALAPR